MAVKVFGDNGYKVTQTEPTKLVFEKQGTRMNNIAYGNWLGDDDIWVRVKVTMVRVAEATYRLDYQAFMVRDKGKMLEEEVKVTSLQTGSYRKLVKQVAEQFRKKEDTSAWPAY